LEPRKTEKRGHRPFGHRSVELHFSFCFQQKPLWGVGGWLRDTGRGPQEIAKIAKIAKHCRNWKANLATDNRRHRT